MEEGLFNEIKNFKKKLNPVVTVERKNTYINEENVRSGHGHNDDTEIFEYFDNPTKVVGSLSEAVSICCCCSSSSFPFSVDARGIVGVALASLTLFSSSSILFCVGVGST